jgi:hypothetical protein
VFYTLADEKKIDGNTLKIKKPSESYSEGFLKSSNNKWAKSPFFLSASVRTMGNMVGVEGIEPPTSTL